MRLNATAAFLLIVHGAVYYVGPRMRATRAAAYFVTQVTLAIAIGLFVDSLWSMGVLLGALALQTGVLARHRFLGTRRP